MTDARIDYGAGSASRTASGLLERVPDRTDHTVGLRRGDLDRFDTAPLLAPPLVDDVQVDEAPVDRVADEVRAAGAASRGRSVLALLAASSIAAAAVALGVVLLGRPLGLAVVAVLLVAVVLGYRFVVQPRHVRWGATDAEVDAVLPGDELLEDAPATTRAVTIDAPVEQVWEWLVQLGIGPNGWTARGLVDDGDLGGSRIVPRLGVLGGGRSRSMPGAGFEVHRIESPSTIVSQGPDGTTWCLLLVDVGKGRSRLISRFSSRVDLVPGSPMVLADPAAFLSERRMLLDLKARAESGAPLQRVECPCAP